MSVPTPADARVAADPARRGPDRPAEHDVHPRDARSAAAGTSVVPIAALVTGSARLAAVQVVAFALVACLPFPGPPVAVRPAPTSP